MQIRKFSSTNILHCKFVELERNKICNFQIYKASRIYKEYATFYKIEFARLNLY